MKKSMFILLMSFSTIQITAQPTLNATTSNYQVGDTIKMYEQSQFLGSGIPGPSGANVSWDFSDLIPGDSVFNKIQNNTSPNFPNADVVMRIDSSNVYYSLSSTALTFTGYSDTGISYQLSDGMEELRYPMNFNDQYTDGYSGTINISGVPVNFQATGQAEVTADGYGILKLPQGDFQNVMRVKIEQNDTIAAGGMSNAITTLRYMWLDELTRYPLAIYTEVLQAGGEVSISFMDAEATLSIMEEHLRQDFSVYPNPASDFTVLENSGLENYSVEMLNLDGKTHRTINLKAGATVNLSLSEMPAGLYKLQISAEDGTSIIKKLVVK